MTTRTEARAALRELSSALKVVHRRLLTAVQRHFEKLHGRVGPGAALQLAVKDPLFTWLDPLTRQIAAVDELLAGEADVDAVQTARAAVSKLLEDDAEFRASYHVYLQSEPDVVVAHATLRRLLRGHRPDGARGA
jgi:hypothetical protein